MNMNKATTNQVKQVLMNELGLTRENIRTLTEELVETTLVKHLNRMEKEGKITKLITKYLVSLLRLDQEHYQKGHLLGKVQTQLAHKLWEQLKPQISIMPAFPPVFSHWEKRPRDIPEPWGDQKQQGMFIRWQSGAIQHLHWVESWHTEKEGWYIPSHNENKRLTSDLWQKVTHISYCHPGELPEEES